MPRDFPRAKSESNSLVNVLTATPNYAHGIIDVGWDESSNVQMSTGNDFTLRIPKLYDQGALFLIGPNARRARILKREMRYVTAARFGLGDANTIHRAAIKAMGDYSRPKKVIVMLPDTPSIRSTYGPRLESILGEYFGLPTRQRKIFVEYHPYEAIEPTTQAIFLRSRTASVGDYSLGTDLELVTSTSSIPLRLSLSGSQSNETQGMALLTNAGNIESENINRQIANTSSDPWLGDHQHYAEHLLEILQQPRTCSITENPPEVPQPSVEGSHGPVFQNATRDVEVMGQVAQNEVKVTHDTDLRIVDLSNHGAFFIYCGSYSAGYRYIIGVKFTLDVTLAETLDAAAQLILVPGSVQKVKVMLPGSHESTTEWRPIFMAQLFGVMDIPSLDLIYYDIPPAPFPELPFTASFTANLNDFELERSLN